MQRPLPDAAVALALGAPFEVPAAEQDFMPASKSVCPLLKK